MKLSLKTILESFLKPSSKSKSFSYAKEKKAAKEFKRWITDHGALSLRIDPDKMLNALAKKYGFNLRNSSDLGFLSGLLVAADIMHPNEVGGDSNAYQAAVTLYDDPDAWDDEEDIEWTGF